MVRVTSPGGKRRDDERFLRHSRAQAKKWAASNGHRLRKWRRTRRVEAPCYEATCELCSAVWVAVQLPDGTTQIGCPNGVGLCAGNAAKLAEVRRWADEILS